MIDRLLRLLLFDTRRIDALERRIKTLPAKLSDLDDKIAALPKEIEAAVDAAVKPIIDALIAKQGGSQDFQTEIDALNNLAGTVSGQVATDLTPTP